MLLRSKLHYLLNSLLYFSLCQTRTANEVKELECTYYVGHVQYEEGSTNSPNNNDEDEIDSCLIESKGMFNLVGMTSEFKKANEKLLKSGEAILTISGAKMRNGEVQVPKGAKMIITEKETKYSKLATTGTRTVLAIRTDAPDSSTTPTKEEISDAIFGTDGNSFTLVTQYKTCSYNQFNLKPFKGKTLAGMNIEHGVTNVDIDLNITGTEYLNDVVNAIYFSLEKKLGDLESQFDFIMFCLPPGGKGDWIGFAWFNYFISLYLDTWCTSTSLQVHEVGHNINLGHSGRDSTGDAYADRSCYMGYSTLSKHGPYICFNGPKSWQLGWYSNSHVIINPTLETFEGVLVGIADYKKNKKQNIIIRLTGSDSIYDYYLMYHHQKGIISDTREGVNRVLLTYQQVGIGYDSWLLATLGADTEYTISQYSQTKDVVITVHSTGSSGGVKVSIKSIRKHPSTISFSPTSATIVNIPPTIYPSPSPSTQEKVQYNPTSSPSTTQEKCTTKHDKKCKKQCKNNKLREECMTTCDFDFDDECPKKKKKKKKKSAM